MQQLHVATVMHCAHRSAGMHVLAGGCEEPFAFAAPLSLASTPRAVGVPSPSAPSGTTRRDAPTRSDSDNGQPTSTARGMSCAVRAPILQLAGLFDSVQSSAAATTASCMDDAACAACDTACTAGPQPAGSGPTTSTHTGGKRQVFAMTARQSCGSCREPMRSLTPWLGADCCSPHGANFCCYAWRATTSQQQDVPHPPNAGCARWQAGGSRAAPGCCCCGLRG